MEWLNQDLWEREDRLAKEFRAGDPFPHITIRDFLSEPAARELREALGTQAYAFKDSDLFSFHQTGDLLESKNPTIASFIAFLKSKRLTEFIAGITGSNLNGAIDAMAVIYTDTNHLLCHDDQLEGRKVAFVLNLCEDFTHKDGGALALLDSDEHGRPNTVVKRLVPAWNTANLFTVNARSHHLVEEVLTGKERLSWTGWFHGQ